MTKRGVVCVRVINVSYMDEGVVEDIVHFLLHCGEFAGDEEDYLGMIEGIDETEEWMTEWRNKGDEGRGVYCWVDL